MHIQLSRKASQTLAGLMLFAFAVRALMPVGFMPSSERPFSVEICHGGFATQLLLHPADPHQGAGHSDNEHCVFGMTCLGGPPSWSSALTGLLLSSFAPAARSVAGAIVVRLVYLPHSRAPPATT